MSARSEEEAAYFALLRAREERDDLLSYREYLDAELARLETFVDAVDEAAEDVPRKMRRPIAGTRRALLEGIGIRRSAVLDERARWDDRFAAAEAFVQEAEEEHATLRG